MHIAFLECPKHYRIAFVSTVCQCMSFFWRSRRRSPLPQNTEDCRLLKKNETTNDTRHTPHARHTEHSIAAVQWRDNGSTNKGLEINVDHTRLPTNLHFSKQQKRCCVCGSIHVSHTSRDPQLYRSQGQIKKSTNISSWAQPYSADKLPQVHA